MRVRYVLLCTAIVAVVLLIGNVNGSKSSRRPTDLDLKTPLTELSAKLKAAIEKFNLVKFISVVIEIVLAVLPCIPLSLADIGIGSFIPFNRHNVDQFLSELYIQEKRFTSHEPFISKENITAFCNSPGFETIHNYVWVEDNQLNDLVGFLNRFGYPDIYTTGLPGLYDFYECPAALKQTLPTGPNPPASTKNMDVGPSNVREEFLEYSKHSLNHQNQCNLTEVITKLIQLESTGFFQVLDLLDTAIQQFSSQPSLHFLVGKIQESRKGKSFRKFRLLNPVRELLYNGHQQIISDPNLKMILELIKSFLGIDLIKTNILETITSLIELILWKTTEVVPPYTPPTPPPFQW